MELRAATATRVVLRGSRVVLIGPLDPNNRQLFLSGFGRASPESMYKRFMTPLPRLSRAQLAYLLGVDHQDHEALLAIDEDDGEAVAVGRFVRLQDSPPAAEAAVLVIDDWQGLGLGKAICRQLVRKAALSMQSSTSTSREREVSWSRSLKRSPPTTSGSAARGRRNGLAGVG